MWRRLRRSSAITGTYYPTLISICRQCAGKTNLVQQCFDAKTLAARFSHPPKKKSRVKHAAHVQSSFTCKISRTAHWCLPIKSAVEGGTRLFQGINSPQSGRWSHLRKQSSGAHLHLGLGLTALGRSLPASAAGRSGLTRAWSRGTKLTGDGLGAGGTCQQWRRNESDSDARARMQLSA